jgi:hypothetical protein
MAAILRGVEQRFHGLGKEERKSLEPRIQELRIALDHATHSLIEVLGPEEEWNIKA